MEQNNNVQVISYVKEHKAEDLYDIDFKETRWRIVNTDTGEIIDDAQGYGYTSKKKAWKAYYAKKNWKKNGGKITAFKKTIKDWWAKNKELESDIMDTLFYALKDNEEIKDSELIEYMRNYIKDHNIEKPEGIHTWQLYTYYIKK